MSRRTITVEFFGHWGLGKTTVATEVIRQLSGAGIRCASPSDIAHWRAVAGVCIASAARVSSSERLLHLTRSIVRHPLVAGAVGCRLLGRWLRLRRNPHALGVLKNMALQKAIAGLGQFDVVVWDEGSITSACAGANKVNAEFDHNALIDALCTSVDEDLHLFVGLLGDVDTIFERWNHRHPPSENSVKMTERLRRARAKHVVIGNVVSKLKAIVGEQVLLVEATTSVNDNASKCTEFILERLNQSGTRREAAVESELSQSASIG